MGFAVPIQYGLVRASDSIVAGDFNGDGVTDLVVANGSTANDVYDSVGLLLGNCDGSFQPADGRYSGSNTLAIVSGDFNRDGRLDLAAASVSAGVTILLGRGDGWFERPIAYGDDPAVGLAVGDFNADGHLDLIEASYRSVRALVGVGDGTFAPKPWAGTSHPIVSIAVADLARDGTTEVAVGQAGDAGLAVSVFRVVGDGELVSAGDFPAGTSARLAAPVLIGDVDRDGALDLIVGQMMLRGHGDRTFAPARQVITGTALALIDLDADGALDLVASDGTAAGRGDGTFARSAHVGPNGFLAAVGDWNGDCRPDIALITNEGRVVHVALNESH